MLAVMEKVVFVSIPYNLLLMCFALINFSFAGDAITSMLAAKQNIHKVLFCCLEQAAALIISCSAVRLRIGKIIK